MKAQRASLFERVKAGLEAGIQFAKGERGLRTVDRVAPPPEMRPDAIRAMRQARGMSQAALAETLAVSVKTLQSWEQGTRTPSPLACRLLQIVAAEPDTVSRVVAAKENGGPPRRRRKRTRGADAPRRSADQ